MSEKYNVRVIWLGRKTPKGTPKTRTYHFRDKREAREFALAVEKRGVRKTRIRSAKTRRRGLASKLMRGY